jgi:hypothetical protein
MASLLVFPAEIITMFYSYLNFIEHIHFSGICQYIRSIGKELLPRDENFEKKKVEFILARATSDRIWLSKDWMKLINFGESYEKNFGSFDKTGMKFKEFALAHPEHFEVYAERVWNVVLFGKPKDR